MLRYCCIILAIVATLVALNSDILAQGIGISIGVDDLRDNKAGPPAVIGNLLLVGGGNILLVGGGNLQCLGPC